MLNKIILASKSEVRKVILDKNNIECVVEPSNVDEDPIKKSLLKEQAKPQHLFTWPTKALKRQTFRW